MGLFSWKTMDTNRSIPASYSNRNTFPVTMTDNNGNKWYENEYEGYGVFGGKDYYELLAEMNDKNGRENGISIAFGDKAYLAPNLSEDSNWKWENKEPDSCEYQGYFYPEDDNEHF